MKDFIKGLFSQNPIFVLLLGMCPTLAVTTKAVYGLSMGLSVIFVLLTTGIVVSLIRKLVPNEVRIPSFIVIIATSVTVADIFLRANYPDISKALGPYVPLIVVNCIILGRAEAFFSKHNIFKSILDALGMGIGFTLGLIILGGFRELLADGTIFNVRVFPNFYPNILLFSLPGGAFISLGILIGIFNSIKRKKI